MKKILFVSVLFLSMLSSCNKDDAKEESTPDTIIATWKIDKVYESGVDVANGCDKFSRLTFNEDGSFTIVKKIIAAIDCETVMDSSGTWTNVNGNYTVEFSEGGIDMIIRIDGEILIEGLVSDSRVEWVKIN